MELPPRNKYQFSANVGLFRLRFDRHTEFTSYRIIRPGAFDDPFANPAAAYRPEDWLDAMPGESLVAAHLALLPARQARPGPMRWPNRSCRRAWSRACRLIIGPGLD